MSTDIKLGPAFFYNVTDFGGDVYPVEIKKVTLSRISYINLRYSKTKVEWTPRFGRSRRIAYSEADAWRAIAATHEQHVALYDRKKAESLAAIETAKAKAKEIDHEHA